MHGRNQPIRRRNSPLNSPLSKFKKSLSEVLETKTVSSRTKANITRLYDEFGNEKIFGRGDVMAVLGITERPATVLIGRMYELEFTERITGAGKGKYRFVV